ncbi:response regulator, partial [candidate division KSB3 bacterium]|nr:response regulator [candidate division KSB3 bacterium]
MLILDKHRICHCLRYRFCLRNASNFNPKQRKNVLYACKNFSPQSINTSVKGLAPMGCGAFQDTENISHPATTPKEDSMSSDSNHRVLVIDTEIDSSKMLADMMRAESCDAAVAASIDEAHAHLQRAVYDIIFLDPAVDEANAFSFLDRLQKEYSSARGIIVSGRKTTDLAIKALRAGTFDFLTKPLHLSEVRSTLQRAVESIDSARTRTSRERFSGSSRKARDRKLIGKSQKMKELRSLIETVAATGATVLIRGESGTGKELVAQALHYQSHRNNGPLVPVNCGAIPEDLLESELFGHVRGAFTGAVRDRAGRFVLANGGTIFLDEIGDMSPKLQVKVLRVLQEQELEPVGGGQTVHVDVRVLAATNVDLEKAVEERRFREDLYY